MLTPMLTQLRQNLFADLEGVDATRTQRSTPADSNATQLQPVPSADNLLTPSNVFRAPPASHLAEDARPTLPLRFKPRVLTPEQIETFIRDGVLVVPRILTKAEVQAAMDGMSATMHKHGVDPNNLAETASNVAPLSSTGKCRS